MPPERTAGGFGGRLRDARERRGVSLRQIASATKISVGVLDALERNDVSKLPGGIFGRAFVRSYAVEVGLDPEATIQDFITQFPDSAMGRLSPPHEERAAEPGNRRSPGALMWLVALGVAIVIVALYVVTLRRSGSGEQLLAKAAPAAATVPSTVIRPAPDRQPSTDSPSLPVAPQADSAAIASPPAGPALPPPLATATSGDQLTVTLAARRPCWVSATVDGRKAIERLLHSGEQQVVTVRRDMVLTAGDASAIVLRFNGVDGRTLGKAGEVVTARFNVSNYKDYLQAP